MLKAQTIAINGQQQVVGTASADNFGDKTTGISEKLTLYQSFLNRPGTWTITLALVSVGVTSSGHINWSTLCTDTFTFTVPA
ncbi:MAG TPA: hypothetical protein VGD98_11350 [Ktedonobacteraceae bacterium]